MPWAGSRDTAGQCSANSRLSWPAGIGSPMVESMTAITQPAGTLDDQFTARLLDQRIIVLGTEVDDRVANRLCAQLLLLSAENSRADISLYINSPGGSVTAGLAIYDTMRLIPNDVSTLAMGLAASMGQFLLCAGTAGQAVQPAARPGADAPGLGRLRRHGGRRGDLRRAAGADRRDA